MVATVTDAAGLEGATNWYSLAAEDVCRRLESTPPTG
jgi:hypothetical protein